MERVLTEFLKVRIEKDLIDRLDSIALLRGETRAEVTRRLLRKATDEEFAEEGINALLSAIRQAVRDSSKPFEERLAKINAKSAIASATDMFMAIELLGHMGKDVRALHENARKKAVAFVKTPANELMGDE